MIKSVKYTNFCQHKDYILSPEPGLNVILGENTTGKTNLLEGLSYGVFGKTNHSTIDKVINYDAKSATIDVSHSDFNLSRTRKKASSKIEGTAQQDLNSKINFSYEEYLRIFYISRQESTKLFDASYFKKFLIELFNTEKYAHTYERLRQEKQALLSVPAPRVYNKSLQTKRLEKVKAIRDKYIKLSNTIGAELNKYTGLKEKIDISRGQLRSKQDEYSKKVKKLQWTKCFTCGKPITNEEKKTLANTLRAAKPKLIAAANQIETKHRQLQDVINKYRQRLSKIEAKTYKCTNLMRQLKERLRDKDTPNLDRLKVINSILPVFSSNGFPSYLLQTYTPIIQETANSLLALVFKDLSINIRTHRPNSNIPDFKIMILRNDEEAGTLSDVSGAESVLINLCLRLGIIVIYKQLHSTCIDWMALDESLDKVDENNSDKILSLLSNFIKMGYLKQIFLVTHKKELKELDNVNYIKL
jgi:DNA repair exonuclease SbcCD ATPase subunit